MNKERFPASKTILDTFKQEYERENKRIEHLTNKVNVILVFYGVLFTNILKYLNFSKIIQNNAIVQMGYDRTLCIAFYVAIAVLVVALSIITLYNMIDILKIREYHILTLDDFFERHLVNYSENEANYYLMARYYSVIKNNQAVNDMYYGKYKKVMQQIKWIVAGTVVLELFETNLFL